MRSTRHTRRYAPLVDARTSRVVDSRAIGDC
ncbi:hypothetical protein P3T35_003276 [Kitasatospora sp. GP30]|nr:hypothetical protein [Kitasatospora sp. GP30]